MLLLDVTVDNRLAICEIDFTLSMRQVMLTIKGSKLFSRINNVTIAARRCAFWHFCEINFRG